MFDTILIANRGEIACRVMETARAMGVRVVAVYSDADRGAKHVQMADVAVHIGGAAPAESYLRGEAIIAAAKETGAQAIHPGYGFLSENPEFVDAVEAAGLVFIGPSAEAIRAMGLKDAAKALMDRGRGAGGAGLSRRQSGRRVFGRAGRGDRLSGVDQGRGGRRRQGDAPCGAPEDFADALASAQGEAATAFGNSDVLIEKFVQQPRHIEVQVFGDGERAVHLFERDCSLQRRHQKVIEEAPAPGMTDEMRAAMGEAAVRAAEAIGYKGAGTVEFIVDGSRGLRADGFWFMEMNTRLQVEHPVTEAITGVDLGGMAVAGGQWRGSAQGPRGVADHRPCLRGAALCRGCAEGVFARYGALAHLAFPRGAGRQRRADGRRDFAILRSDDRQADHPWPKPGSRPAQAVARLGALRGGGDSDQPGLSRRFGGA